MVRLRSVGHGVIDGDRWIKQRLAFLREALNNTELSEGQRQAVEDEIRRLSSERGIRAHGRRRWLPRFPWPGRRPADEPSEEGSPAGEGSSAEGSAEEGSAEEGSTVEGSTVEGSAEEGSPGEAQPQPSSSNRESDIPK